MTHKLQQIQPKLVVALEGGYNLDSIRKSSEAIVRTLMGHPEEAMWDGMTLDLAAYDCKHSEAMNNIDQNDKMGVMARNLTLKLAIKL